MKKNDKPADTLTPIDSKRALDVAGATQTVGADMSSRILRFAELHQLTGLSKAHIDRLEQMGDFCGRIRLGRRAVGWLYSEVCDWIQERARNRQKEVGK